ncbi:MAG: DUF7088 domain-containing protein [Chthoniobacterales bacterium]
MSTRTPINPSPEPGKRPSPLRSVRLRVALQIAAALVVTGSVLTWSFGHYRRYDLSRSHKFELSHQSKNTLWNLKSPMRVIVYFSPSSMATGSELHGDIMGLLREYQFYAHHYRDMTVESVDPLREPARARQIQAEYKFSGEENVLIVEYAGRSTVIPVPEMGEYDSAPTQYGDRPRLVAFRGELILTSALIALVEPGSNKKAYFLQGHGEGLPGVPPMQLVGQNLKRQNISVAPLNLAGGNAVIPDDAALVVIAGAHFDPSAEELTALQSYWKRGGHLMVLLDPTGETPGLDALLSSAGITPRHDRVVRLVSLGGAMGILRDVTGEFFGGSEITGRLVGLNILFAGNTCSLALDFDPQAPEKTRPLIRAIHGFRGCSNYANADGKGVTFDPVKDNFFPVIIAAMTDLGGVRDDRVSLGASRMVVVGNCEFLKDKFLAGTGLDFLSSAVNTLTDRTHLTGTTPKIKEFFTLNLDEQQIRFLALWTMLAVPLGAALLGALVLWRRRP